MAIYHMSVKIIGRSSGRSAVACSAYRSGSCLVDEEQGKTQDYTKKKEVLYSEIVLPEHAPDCFLDRSTLWNEVQQIEKTKDAQLAREFEVAIPNELDEEQAKELVHSFSESLAKEGMIVDASIHWKEGNHHAHLMATTRPLKEDGSWGQKEKKVYATDDQGNKIPVIDPKTGEQKIGARGRKMWKRVSVESNDWNKKEKLEEWRERWATECNRYLSQEKQIDHRSYEKQGIELEPTRHEGVVVTQIERKAQYQAKRMGVEYEPVTDIRKENLEIRQRNEVLKKIIEELKEIKNRIVELIQDKGASINDRISELLRHRETYQSQRGTAGRERTVSESNQSAYESTRNGSEEDVQSFIQHINARTESARADRINREAERERQRIERSKEAERICKDGIDQESKTYKKSRDRGIER